MNILAIGDIVGRPGRKVLGRLLNSVVAEYKVDFVIANAENAAGGRGITKEVLHELLGMGIDVLTMGNHVWDNKEIFSFIDNEYRIVRPANYPDNTPGQGFCIYTAAFSQKVAVINISGRIFMPVMDCPFKIAEQIIQQLPPVDYIIVDFHAEATSEKQALAYYLDGRVTAVLGTHTHVQTADAKILPQGSAYITDLGMTGAVESVLGMVKEQAIKKFVTQLPVRLEVADKGPLQLQGVVLNLNDESKFVADIVRINLNWSE